MRMRFERGVLAALLFARVCVGQDSASAHVKLGAGFLEKREYAKAVPELRKALELQPDRVDAHGMLGQALLAQGFSTEAIPHLERAQRIDLLGIALAEEHRSGPAIEKLLAALEQKPDDPDLLFYLGKASGALMQRSFDTLMRAVAGSARAHQLMAETYLAQQNVEAARLEYLKALELQRDLRGIHLALGTIHSNAGNLDGAEKEFRAETALSPGDGQAAWRLGSVLLRKGRVGEALAELKRSDGLRPRMIETLFDLAKAYSMDNKVPEAEKTWLAVIAIDDDGEVAAATHFQLAQLYRRQGKTAEAERHSKRFQQLQPKVPLGR